MIRSVSLLAVCLAVSIGFSGCGKNVRAPSNVEASTGPVPATVVPAFDPNNFHLQDPDKFKLATATAYVAAPELNVTGVVNPDVSRQVPVISLASGKVVELDVHLGDTVQKGQLLFKVRSSDIAGAYADYRKALANEQLTKIQLDRAKLLYENGAVAKSALETAQTAENNAQVDLETAIEHLHLLGSDIDHPSGIVPVYAPVSGVITDQQITDAAGVQALSTPSPLTISDLSHVWIVCDVYQNELSQVHVGEFADIHLDAYPNRVLKARISDILPILDPNIRTAKVRLQVENPGILKVGMFVTASFHGLKAKQYASVPSTAIVHLHDREWVYMPLGNGNFKRQEIVSGNMLPDNMQEVISGIQPGDRVVSDALALENTIEQ